MYAGLIIIGEERLAGNSIRRDDCASANPMPDRHFAAPMETVSCVVSLGDDVRADCTANALIRSLLSLIAGSGDVSNPLPSRVGMWQFFAQSAVVAVHVAPLPRLVKRNI